MLMDESPSLGKMDIFQDATAFFAGYNVRLFLITQSKTQIGQNPWMTLVNFQSRTAAVPYLTSRNKHFLQPLPCPFPSRPGRLRAQGRPLRLTP